MRPLLWRWLLLAACVLPGPASAEAGLAAAKLVNLLQSIQGNWQAPCSPAYEGGFRRVKLSASFTHFNFSVDRYRDQSCSHPIGSSQARYRFVLGNEQILEDGSRAFAVSAVAEGAAEDTPQLSFDSFLRKSGGRLYLIPAHALSAQGNSFHLDYGAVYHR